MTIEMLYRLTFSISSLVFLILLIITYKTKKYKLKLKSKIFNLFIVVCLGVILAEIITYMYFAIGNNQYIYASLTRLHGFVVICWGFVLINYIYALIYNPTEEDIYDLVANHKILKIHFILSIIFVIVDWSIKSPDVTVKVANFMPNYAIPCIIHYLLTAIVCFILVIINFKNLKTKDKIILFVLLFEVPFFAFLQSQLPPVAFLSLCNCIQVYLIYSYYENPDLFIADEIKHLTTQTENINRVKSEFLSNMTHEIRSPINGIMGYSENILNEQDFNKEKVVNDIATIKSLSENLLEIINNILDLSKVESAEDELEERDYSLCKVVKDLSSIAKNRIGTKPIELIIDIEDGIPDKLHGDSSKLYEVLLNIMTNAAKYTEVGKIKFTIKKKITGDKINLIMTIADTGYGIKKEDFAKMFEKFSRLKDATNKEIEGTGLGLAITKRYVDLMKGTIRFESEYGVGTTFFIEVPQIICKNQIDDIETEANELKFEDVDLSKYTVLIVDDNNLNIKVLEKMLTKYKLNVKSFTSGKDCIYSIKKGDKYDLIFLDQMMPDMNGLETFNIISKLSNLYDIPPVVACTANAIKGAKEAYINEGFVDYLSKPIEKKELERILREQLIK